MDYDESELDAVADNIINQLKNGSKSIQQIEAEYPELSPEEIDSFVLKYASKAIIDLSGAVSEQTELVKATGDDKQVTALAELVNSFKNTLEVLQKRSIADDKNETSIKIKQMDIDSKKEAQAIDNNHKLLMSREEIFKMLMENEKLENSKMEEVDGEVIDI